MHKRVCGERSNPFLWPKLTKSEVDKIVQVSEVPTPKFGSWLGKWSMNRFRTVDGGKLAFRVRFVFLLSLARANELTLMNHHVLSISGNHRASQRERD